MTVHHPRDERPGLVLGEPPPAAATALDQHPAGRDPARSDESVLRGAYA